MAMQYASPHEALEELYKCAVTGDFDRTEDILTHTFDLNALDEKTGSTALSIAAKFGHVMVVDELLHARAEPNIASSQTGRTPLHEAVATDNLEVLQVLLRHKANPDLKTKKGETPIFFAASKAGRAEEIVPLAEQKSDDDPDATSTTEGASTPESKTSDEQSAAAPPKKDSKKEEPKTPPPKKGWSPFKKKQKSPEPETPPPEEQTDMGEVESPEELAWRTKEDILDALANHGADPNIVNEEGTSPLVAAIEMENVYALQALLDCKGNPNVTHPEGDPAVLMATRRLHVRMVHTLLKAGADPRQSAPNGSTAMFVAHFLGDRNDLSDEIQDLLRFYGDDAAFAQAYKVVSLARQSDLKNLHLTLRRGGVSVDAADRDGMTALHAACALWCSRMPFPDRKILRVAPEELASYLMNTAKCTTVNHEDKNGQRPLHLLCKGTIAPAKVKILNMLVESKADIDARDKHERTALHYSCVSGQPSLAGQLLRHGADIRATDAGQSMALHFAARRGHVEVIEVLLSHLSHLQSLDDNGDGSAGGSVDELGQNGCTALHFSCRGGHTPCVRALIRAGAQLNLAQPDGATPLQLAATYGHYDLCDLLVTYGADHSICDEFGEHNESSLVTRRKSNMASSSVVATAALNANSDAA